jgi:hypothetical protein
MRPLIVRTKPAEVKSNRRQAYSSLPISLQRHPLMTDAIKSVLMELASWAWGDRAVCWPSNETIGRNVGKHPDRVRVLLAQAEARGFLVRVQDGRQRRLVLTWKLRGGGTEAPAPTSGGARAPVSAPPKAFNGG